MCSGSSITAFSVFAVFTLIVYYISEGYQAVYHASATGAGVRLLPMILVQVFFLILSSRLIPRIGRFKPFLVIGPCFIALSTGLFYSVKYGTSEAHLYGYQVVLGTGIGLCLQNTSLSVQFELKSEPWLISAGTGMVIFSQSPGLINSPIIMLISLKSGLSVGFSVSLSPVTFSRT